MDDVRCGPDIGPQRRLVGPASKNTMPCECAQFCLFRQSRRHQTRWPDQLLLQSDYRSRVLISITTDPTTNPQPKQAMQSNSPLIYTSAISLWRATVVALLAAGATTAFAQTTNIITLTNSDAIGASSFNAAGNWNSGAAPVSAGSPNVNAYFTTNFTLRTPTGSSGYTFAGDSLSIDPFSTNATLVATNIGTGT